MLQIPWKKSVRSIEEKKNFLLSLFIDRSDANLTIACGASTQIVHSFVLWPQSPYFHTVEAPSMHIEFDEDTFLIDRMLIYCYMLSWPELKMKVKDSGKSDEQWVSRLDTIIRMYALGDKFDLQGLKLEAGERFTARLDEPSFGILRPLSGPLQPITEFIVIIPLLYALTTHMDGELRDRAVEYGSKRWKTLWAQPTFRDGLTEIGEFINDVVTKRAVQASSKDASN